MKSKCPQVLQSLGGISIFTTMSNSIAATVWSHGKIKGATLLVLLSLADQADEKGFCWPSFHHTALRCRLSRRQVINSVNELKAAGWLSVEIRKRPYGNTSNGYTVHAPSEVYSLPSATYSPPSENHSTTVVNKFHHLVNAASPISSKESPIEPSVNRGREARRLRLLKEAESDSPFP